MRRTSGACRRGAVWLWPALFTVWLSLCLCSVDGSLAPTVTKEFIIPKPPWPYAHVCNLVERTDGDLIATWQAGSGEKHPDSSIWMARKDYKTGQWSDPSIAVKWDGHCVMNACTYQNASGAIFMTLHAGGGPNGSCQIDQWQGYLSESLDGGQSWNQNLVTLPGCPSCNGCVKNQCTRLSNGEVLCPSSDEHPWYDTAHFETTDESFSNFVRRSSIVFVHSDRTGLDCSGIVQPVIFETHPGTVLALFRSQGCGVLAQAVSRDYGHTWPLFADSSAVPNPGAGVDGVVMHSRPDIGLLLAFNNSTQNRTPLSLAHSPDAGATWLPLGDVETDPTGSFAYPFVLQSALDANTVHMCYTYNVGSFNTIAYAKLQWAP